LERGHTLELYNYKFFRQSFVGIFFKIFIVVYILVLVVVFFPIMFVYILCVFCSIIMFRLLFLMFMHMRFICALIKITHLLTYLFVLYVPVQCDALF